jgi:cytochrome d ubiquinol oxidase subunit II
LAQGIEFRSKMQSPRWRRAWDAGFFVSSLTAALLFGIAVGNGMFGIPLDESGNYLGSFLGLLHPYAVLCGLVTVALFAMHGAIYLFLKLPNGEARNRVHRWMWHTWGVFLVLYILGTMYTLVSIPRATANFAHFPWAVAAVVLSVFAIADIPRAVHRNRPAEAFAASALTILCLVGLFSLALYPNLVTATNQPAHSLTIYNSASSPRTLWTMLIIAMIGIPFVLTYTFAIYWTFRGRVELGEHSY